ncbi:MAG: anti-sigma factor RsiW [Maribacter sp.]|jgi:anti-sigma factor RsiW
MKHLADSLTDYLDGLLDQEKCAPITSHLKECSACKQELEQLKELFGALEQEKVLAG